ncbi:hypothetical protein [Leptolyngbya phage Lbo-JY46]
MRKGFSYLYANDKAYETLEEFFKDYKPNGIIRGNKMKRKTEVPITITEPPKGFSVVADEKIIYNKVAGTSANEIVHDLKVAGYKGRIDIVANVVGTITQTRYYI